MKPRLPQPIPGFGLVALWLVSVCAGQTADTGQPLRVGVTPDFPPLAFKEGGRIAGLEADFAAALGTHLGRPVQWVELRWEDQIPALVEGRTDLIMSSMSVTRARRTQIDFTTPYLRIGQMALIRREDQGLYVLGFPSVLKGTVGVKQGTTGDYLVQQEWPKAKRKTFSSGRDAAEALLKKKIDLFVGDATLVWWLAGAYEAKGLAAAPQLLSEEDLAWGVRKSDGDLLRSANAFLKQAETDGRLKAMAKRWLPAAR